MILGHQKQWNYLKRIAESKRIPHALLFSGQAHLGKKTIAFEFLSLVFGQNCSHHPDLTIIEPAGKEIQIAQIRDVIWRLSLKPYSGFLKAVILDEAHLMNEAAQNCFLKTLEEPKGESVLILITQHPEALYPTILSRCEIIKFYPVGQRKIEDYLESQGIKEKEAKIVSQISQGRPGLAVDFLTNPQKLKERAEKIKELIILANSDLALRFQCAKDLSKSADLRETLNIWLYYFRNILLSKLNNGIRLPDARLPSLRLPPYSFLKLREILRKIQSTISLISNTNVNPRLALEVLMLEF